MWKIECLDMLNVPLLSLRRGEGGEVSFRNPKNLSFNAIFKPKTAHFLLVLFNRRSLGEGGQNKYQVL